MPVISVNKNDFQAQVLRAAGPVLLVFGASWCPACRRLDPVLDQLSVQRPGLIVASVDIDTAPELANRFAIRSVPTLLLMQQGRETGRLVGPGGAGGILELLQQAE